MNNHMEMMQILMNTTINAFGGYHHETNQVLPSETNNLQPLQKETPPVAVNTVSVSTNNLPLEFGKPAKEPFERDFVETARSIGENEPGKLPAQAVPAPTLPLIEIEPIVEIEQEEKVEEPLVPDPPGGQSKKNTPQKLVRFGIENAPRNSIGNKHSSDSASKRYRSLREDDTDTLSCSTATGTEEDDVVDWDSEPSVRDAGEWIFRPTKNEGYSFLCCLPGENY